MNILEEARIRNEALSETWWKKDSEGASQEELDILEKELEFLQRVIATLTRLQAALNVASGGSY